MPNPIDVNILRVKIRYVKYISRLALKTMPKNASTIKVELPYRKLLYLMFQVDTYLSKR